MGPGEAEDTGWRLTVPSSGAREAVRSRDRRQISVIQPDTNFIR